MAVNVASIETIDNTGSEPTRRAALVLGGNDYASVTETVP